MKPFIVVQGPVATRSGYGNHTRDIVTALLKSNKYDVQIISLPWGMTPMDALRMDNPEHVEIDRHIARANINRKPDVFIQISVPNEFQPAGKYNIGITAGVETDQPPGEFIEGCNRMDLILATSEFTKNTLEAVIYEKVDKNTNKMIGNVKIEKPIKVLFEGVDLNVYKKVDMKDVDTSVSEYLDAIPDAFNFLFVGHWLRGDMGQDRKDVGMMIKTFCEAFKNKSSHNRPGLILKTSHATFSIMDRDEVERKIQQIIEPYGNKIPNIYLIHGDLSDTEMNSLYNHNKVKAMISFTKGEGYGRPLLEFTLSEKPVIVSDYSGHKDFLKYARFLPGDLTPVHRSAADQFILEGAKWFTVNYQYAASVLRDCVDNYKSYLNLGKQQSRVSREEFNLDIMSKLLCEYVDTGVSSVPQQVPIKLPNLSAPANAPKISLPTLKKVTA